MHDAYLSLSPLHNPACKLAFDLPSNRIRRRCLIVGNTASTRSIEGDKHSLGHVGPLALVECLNHMMHILYRSACLTSKSGRKSWNPMTLQHFLSRRISTIFLFDCHTLIFSNESKILVLTWRSRPYKIIDHFEWSISHSAVHGTRCTASTLHATFVQILWGWIDLIWIHDSLRTLESLLQMEGKWLIVNGLLMRFHLPSENRIPPPKHNLSLPNKNLGKSSKLIGGTRKSGLELFRNISQLLLLVIKVSMSIIYGAS